MIENGQTLVKLMAINESLYLLHSIVISLRHFGEQ